MTFMNTDYGNSADFLRTVNCLSCLTDTCILIIVFINIKGVEAMKRKTKLIVSVLVISLLYATGTCLADWDPKNKAEVIKLSHEIDQMLHTYHKDLGLIDLKHFDVDFSEKVHELDHAIHDFHELLAKKESVSAELILDDFKDVELKYREAHAMFTYLAHRVHSNKKAGLEWLDFIRKFEELHYLVTGHFSWQDVELDHHNHDHDHGINHGADHGHNH